MISYRDRTFCSAYCATADCGRRWTAELQDAANRWWRGFGPLDPEDEGPPVSFMNFGPTCPDYRQPSEDEDHRVLHKGEANT